MQIAQKIILPYLTDFETYGSLFLGEKNLKSNLRQNIALGKIRESNEKKIRINMAETASI
jgi:hypothetical protein